MHAFNLFIWLGERFSFLSWINEDTIHVATGIFVGAVLIILGFVAFLRLRKTEDFLTPPKKLGIAGVFELAGDQILKMMEGVMGERAIKFLPLIGSLFVYIFVNNLLSLIPGFLPATDNINTNLPCAIIVFLYYNYVGMKENGFFGYLKHFAGPIIWLAPLLFVIELISHIVRPISLSVRLFGNITGDHMVLGIFSELVPIVLPVIFLFLALFVAFIQAFVFSLLSTVYISLAMGDE